jgi:23S rRNA (adenine2503-C2)-methyltransferase
MGWLISSKIKRTAGYFRLPLPNCYDRPVAKNVIDGMSLAELTRLLESAGQPPYRARQLSGWVFRKLARSWEEMTDLPASLRGMLNESAVITDTRLIKALNSADGRTTKLLLSLSDRKTVETVVMRYPEAAKPSRVTVCVSSQVGCAVGCPFCATGSQGFDRNLRAGEIIAQVLQAGREVKRVLPDKDKPINNVVFMGMGEPLLNYGGLMNAVKMLNDPAGFGIGMRGMTVSTSGIVPGILRLAESGMQLGLAVSLHAVNDSTRNRLVPVNQKYPLRELLAACREYADKSRRRLTFEYALFKDINDSKADARELVRICRGFDCLVNLIAGNTGRGSEWGAPSAAGIAHFTHILRESGINSTLRQSLGADIDGGCGQLHSAFEIEN